MDIRAAQQIDERIEAIRREEHEAVAGLSDERLDRDALETASRYAGDSVQHAVDGFQGGDTGWNALRWSARLVALQRRMGEQRFSVLVGNTINIADLAIENVINTSLTNGKPPTD